MDTNSEYYEQLQAINNMLERAPEGPERDELINLKQNIEELLLLTDDSVNPVNAGQGCSGVSQENYKNETSTDVAFEDEYALFMAEIAKEGAVKMDIENKDENKPAESDIIEKLKELEGKKFRAPHNHQWGQLAYHNAMVCSVPKDILDINKLQVKVLFLNPTHKEMLPCPYYFDMEKDCHFSEEQCRFSHGELVDYSSLQDYIEPKFENLTVGSVVLAKQSDDLWYRGKITQISEEKCLVKFESKTVQNENYEEIVFEHILPLDQSENASDDDRASDNDCQAVSDDEESILESQQLRQNLINKSLMITPDSVPLGDWEKYTKGIGSKLMQKMGYIVGTGLGKEGSGIIKPVTALILPQGKSLDFCMNLKEESQNPNLFHADNVTKGRKRKEKKPTGKVSQKHKKVQQKIKVEQMDLGQYINYNFSLNQNPIVEKETITFREKLKVATVKDVNVANFTIDQHIQRRTGKMEQLKAKIRRLEDKHQEPKKLYKKLKHTNNGLKRFSNFGLLVKNELDRRKNNKEMAVF